MPRKKEGKKQVIISEFGPVARYEWLIKMRNEKVNQGMPLKKSMCQLYKKFKNRPRPN
jgi:hypothetical protein